MTRLRYRALLLSLLLVGAVVGPVVGTAGATTDATDGFAVSIDDPTPEPHDSVTISVDEATLPDGATLVWDDDGELGTNRCLRHANCTVRVGAEPVTVTVEAHVGDRVVSESVEITPVELSLSETLVDRDGETLSSVGYRVLVGERLELRATDEVGSGATVANVSAAGPVARVGAEPTAFEFTGPGEVELTVTTAATDRAATETASLSFRAHEPGTLEDTERFALRSAEPLSRNDRIVLAALKPELPTIYERYEQRAGELPDAVTLELAEPRARSYAVAPDTVVVANGKSVHGVRTTLVHELAHLGQYEAAAETDGGWNFLIEGHASYEQSATLPYDDTLSKPSADALLEWNASYDQAHYFVASYVAEYGRQSLLDLLADSEGSDFERQFRAETGESFDSFHERWMSGGPDDPAGAWNVFETKPMFAYENGTLRTLAEPLDGVEVSWDTDGDGTFERVDAGHAAEWTPPASGRHAVTVRFTAGNESIEGTQVLSAAGRDDSGGTGPRASFTVASDSVAVGETVTFEANATANEDDATYRWDLDGDGTAEVTGETVEHTYSRHGTYDVTLIVETSDGETDSATEVVTVSRPLEVSVSPPTLRPETTTTVEVAVTDAATGQSVEDATVAVRDRSRSATTGADGTASVELDVIPAGEYWIDVSADGYEDADATLTVEDATAGPDVPGVSPAVSDAVAGGDGEIDADDVRTAVRAYFRSDGVVDGVTVTADDIRAAAEFYFRN